MIDFEEYLRDEMPDQKAKASAWKTAIGLQAVDGLQISEYLKEAALDHIEGNISIEEVKALIDGYYQSKTARTQNENETEEADKVSIRIAQILNEKSFAFSVTGFTSIHRRLFEDVIAFAGKIRDYDITKKEWVLRGDTVLYVNAADLHRAIAYDLEQERNFSYKGLSLDEVVIHIAKFVPTFGKFIRLVKAIQEQPPYSLSSIYGVLALRWIILRLPITLGFSAML